jgi:drug/metabolite transporter (DMT)-like permease
MLDASLASLTFFAQPVVGAALGVALLGEQASAPFYAGGLLIAIGLLLASRTSRPLPLGPARLKPGSDAPE